MRAHYLRGIAILLESIYVFWKCSCELLGHGLTKTRAPSSDQVFKSLYAVMREHAMYNVVGNYFLISAIMAS